MLPRRGWCTRACSRGTSRELEEIGLVLAEDQSAEGKPTLWTLTDPPTDEGGTSSVHPQRDEGGHAACTPGMQAADSGGVHPASTPPVNGGKKGKKSPSDEGDCARVFAEWVKATGRSPARTKLTGERRRRIEKALASHGLEDCLAAVRHIGEDPWARGENDRHTRFDDVEHALGDAKRIERWRDWTPPPVSGRDAQADRDAAVLDGLIGAAA